MKKVNREDIIRMVGLHGAANLMRAINNVQLAMEEQNGKLVTYWTEIQKDEKQISLIAGRMDDAETNIGQLQVTAQQLTASVSSLTTTVDGHTSSIGQLQITANSLTASVSSLNTTVSGHTSKISSLELTDQSLTASVSSLNSTVSGHTSKISALELTDSSISNRVSVIEGDYVKEAEISLMVKKDGNGYISNASIKADNIDFTFTRSTNFISGGQTVMSIDNGGNLWLLGEFRGGTITQNVLIGADSSDALYKMVLYTDEKISSSLPWLSSGIRGVLNSRVYLDIGFAGVGGQTAYPRITLNNGGSGSSFKYTTLSHDRLSFGSSSKNRLIIGYPSDTSRIYIHGNYADWYKDTELSSIAKGDVYIDSNGFLKVKNY